MTSSGYISDRSCPGNTEHGAVVGMRTGGYFCPHADHSAANPPTKAFWSEDEFEQAKGSQPIQLETPRAKKQVRHRRSAR